MISVAFLTHFTRCVTRLRDLPIWSSAYAPFCTNKAYRVRQTSFAAVARRLRSPVGVNFDGREVDAPVGEFWLPFAVARSNRRATITTLGNVRWRERKRVVLGRSG